MTTWRSSARFPLRNALYITAALIASRTNKAWYHALFAICGLLVQVQVQVIWIVGEYDAL